MMSWESEALQKNMQLMDEQNQRKGNTAKIRQLQSDLESAQKVRNFQYNQACKYARHATKLEIALAKIIALQEDCLDAGDLWKAIREIVNGVEENDER